MDNSIQISLLCTIIACVVGFITLQKKTKKETKEEAMEASSIKEELKYISRGVDDIRLDMRAQNKRIDVMNERLTRVEESCKSAHHRIDEELAGK